MKSVELPPDLWAELEKRVRNSYPDVRALVVEALWRHLHDQRFHGWVPKGRGGSDPWVKVMGSWEVRKP